MLAYHKQKFNNKINVSNMSLDMHFLFLSITILLLVTRNNEPNYKKLILLLIQLKL